MNALKDPNQKMTGSGDDPESGRAADIINLRNLRKFWPTAMATTLVVVLATAFFTLGQKKVYEAEATLMFDPTPPSPLGSSVESVVDMGAGNFWNNQEYYETQYNIIRSRRVALAVVNELGLQDDPSFLQNLPEGQSPEQTDRVAPEAAAELVRSRLEVRPVQDSRLAQLKFRDANPTRAQRILSTLIDTYVEQNLENAVTSTSSATDWLRGQLDTLKKDLESSEMELHQYKKMNDILSVAFDDKSNMLAEEMKHINAELTRVRALQKEAIARRTVLSSVPANDPTLIQANELLRSPLMNTLRSDYESAVRERDALLGSRKGKNHPAVAAAQGRVDAAEKAILKEIQNIQQAANREVAVLSGQAGGLKGMLEEARKQAHELNLLEIEFNRLKRSKENTDKLYSLVLQRTKEADLTQMLRINNVSVVDRPLVPAAAVSPVVPLNMAIGTLLGLLLGVSAAFGRALMDRTVKVPDDVEKELGMTCLGLLPQLGKEFARPNYGKAPKRHRGKVVDDSKPELIVHNEPASSMAEAARSIRTNLLFMSPDNPHKTLVVTSAGPSEGKTTVTCSIAIAMAQAGQRVALIDCDLRRPRIRRIFGLPADEGVTTAMLENRYDNAFFETEVPNLFVMPSGPIPPNPSELLHTDRFKELLAYAQKHFDRVIIDSAPVVAVTDPTILSTLADGTVLVVRAHKTRKELARHAQRSVAAVGGSIIGVVLNAVDFNKSEYKYSYYYYRRQEYYGPGPDRGDDDNGDSNRDHAEEPRLAG